MTSLPANLPTLQEIRTEQCRRSLAAFIRHGWHVNEQDTPLLWNWHIEVIAMHMQAAFEDWQTAKKGNVEGFVQRIRNLVINVPPGTMKSRIVNVLFPAWVWLHCPSFSFLCLSASESNVFRDSVYCRQVIESLWYQSWFKPDWRLSRDQNAKGFWTNTAGGRRESQAYGASVTGKRADAILTDDPHDAQKVESEVQRDEDVERWDTAISSRVNDPIFSLRITVMQRVHVKDLAGHQIEDLGFRHLRLPMEYESSPYCKCPDCVAGVTAIGWKDTREEGELLFPQRFPADVLTAELNTLGTYGYAGQMQQRPIPEGGAFFQREWFKIEPAAPVRFKNLVRYWDLAGAKPGKGDWTVGALVGEAFSNDGGRFWVLHVDRFQKPADERNAAILQRAVLDKQMYPGTKTFIEQPPGLGKESVDNLVRLMAGYDCEADRVSRDKVTRAEPMKAQARAGNFRIVESKEWNEPFLECLALFPNAPHDDDVDAASGAFNSIVMPDDKKPPEKIPVAPQVLRSFTVPRRK
jgi:predicted phage terminase large subunit-like protein